MNGRPRTLGGRLPAELVRPIISMSVLTVAVILVTANLAMGGALVDLDAAVGGLPYRHLWQEPLPVADWVDRIGQRAVGLPLMFLLVLVIWRRHGFHRPMIIAVLGTLGLNFIIGVLKLTTMRESPRSGGPEFFVGNLLYPSGHAGNVVFIYGLMAAFSLRYGLVHPRRRGIMVLGVAGLTVAMFVISIYRGTHWLTDLAVGAMIGGIMLEGSLLVDQEWDRLRAIVEPAWRRIAPDRTGTTSTSVPEGGRRLDHASGASPADGVGARHSTRGHVGGVIEREPPARRGDGGGPGRGGDVANSTVDPTGFRSGAGRAETPARPR